MQNVNEIVTSSQLTLKNEYFEKQLIMVKISFAFLNPALKFKIVLVL